MLRRTTSTFVAATTRRMAPAAAKAEPKLSTVNGATGGEDGILDYTIVGACCGGFVLWQLFGPPIIPHH